MIEARTSLKGSATALAVVAAASGGATAADVSAFRPSPVAAPTWEGWYAGASLGASWLSSNQDPGGLSFGASSFIGGGASSVGGAGTTAGAAGWMIGLQGGYNWQHSNFVYGLESDISWIGANTASSNSTNGAWGGRYQAASASSSKVDALWTFRTRFGIDFNGTLPYLTAGFALGHIQSTLQLTSYAGSGIPLNVSGISGTSWVPGVVVGGGIEHQLTRNWTLRGEIMWVGFESQQLGNPLNAPVGYAGVLGRGGAEKFTNNLTFGNVGLNYRF